ncbi:P2Y purinoceptor 1-like [Megalops cyprinoides]|uniref:P2Y purinoceptor 1-like n=1 Tax=Megalops cyprinoides TaxID=118141 RepID=UPI0018641594|nr:P2Y purinoceptor 1-like [Megalops cyprinoides]
MPQIGAGQRFSDRAVFERNGLGGQAKDGRERESPEPSHSLHHSTTYWSPRAARTAQCEAAVTVTSLSSDSGKPVLFALDTSSTPTCGSRSLSYGPHEFCGKAACRLTHNVWQRRTEMLLEPLNRSAEFCSQFRDGQWYCFLLLVLYALALPVGIVGNVAALLSYACFRKAWTASSVFLLNLALCDSAWMLTLPFTIYFSLQKPYLRDIQTFCQFKKVSFNVNIYGSIFFLTLISFDRYAGTVHPLSSLSWWDAGKARFCSAAVWMLLLLGSVPDLFVTFAVKRPGNITVCMDHIQGPFAYVRTISITRTLVGFVLPFGLMLSFYMLTARVLRALPSGKRSGRPLRLISAAIAVFVVSFVPYHVMIMTLVFMRVNRLVTPGNAAVLYASYEFLEAVCSISSALDPLLYILASERFQRSCLEQARRGAGVTAAPRPATPPATPRHAPATPRHAPPRPAMPPPCCVLATPPTHPSHTPVTPP